MAERGETLLTLPAALVLIGCGVELALPSGNQLETPVTKNSLTATFETPPRKPANQLAMSDSNQKSYLRDGSGPRAVDSGKGRSSSRRDEERQRSKHSASRRPSDSKSSHRREASFASSKPEAPTFELDVIGQPSRAIVFGQTVETSIMVSLKCHSPEMVARYQDMDTSRLMGVVSLVSEARNGERASVECGTLTGQKMFDSVHECPDHIVESLARSQPCRVSLGYLTFPQLLIRQPGAYRLRVTLIKMGSAGSSGGSTVIATDSELIRVERRSTTGTTGTARKHGRS